MKRQMRWIVLARPYLHSSKALQSTFKGMAENPEPPQRTSLLPPMSWSETKTRTHLVQIVY